MASSARVGRRVALVGILAAVVVVAVTAAAPAPARAAESDDPERLIKRGNDLRRQGDNIRAFGYLQRAHELAGTPRTGAQLGLCEQALGRFADAETHLTAALSTNDAWVDANRAGLEASRSVARKKLGKIQLTGAPPGTTVAIGAAAPVKLPADGALWVTPGATNLALEAPGFRPATRATQVSEGGTATVAAGLTPVAAATVTPVPAVAATASAGTTPAATPPTAATDATPGATPASSADDGSSEGTPDDGRSALRITGLAVAGAGVALVVTGFVLRNMASTKLEAITNDANAMRPYNPANDNWKIYDNSGWALLGVGGAAIVTGAVIYLVNRGDDDTAASSASASHGGRADSAFARRLSLGWTPQQGVSLGYAAAF